jgi:hypothetical protein
MYLPLQVEFSTLLQRKRDDFHNLGLAIPDSLRQDDDVEQSGGKWSTAEFD